MKSVGRVQRALRRYGAGGTIRRSAELVREQFHDDRTYVWYQLELAADRPRRDLSEGLELVEASAVELGALDELWAIDHGEAERRLSSGGRLWLVLSGREPAFSCWTFVGRTPIRAVAGGWLGLPADTTCLEESMTGASFRGRGIAPAAWTGIFDRLEGFRRVVTAVEEENTASRKAVEKIGFAEVGRMHAHRRVGRSRVTVEGDTADAAFLRDAVSQPPP